MHANLFFKSFTVQLSIYGHLQMDRRRRNVILAAIQAYNHQLFHVMQKLKKGKKKEKENGVYV